MSTLASKVLPLHKAVPAMQQGSHILDECKLEAVK